MMLRFVVLRHEPGAPAGKPLHWDLMLESGGVLRTWSLDREPTAQRPIAAQQLADHRLEYLDYEGPVSGNRGTVQQWDSGTYVAIENLAQQISVELQGRVLAGHAVLTRDRVDAQRWTFSFIPADPDKVF